MPKSSKKTAPQKGRQTGQQSTQIDFTLADYADADPAAGKSGRLKKGVTNAFQTNAKELVGSSTDKATDNLAWDEKDLSDFDLTSESGSQPETEDDPEEGSPRAKVKRKKAVAQARSQVAPFSGGREYPADLWFLVGDRISPETVASFSAVCRGAHWVVHTARFWNSLYKRHYRDSSLLPSMLSPRYMDKLHGLRARIVRSLFFLYPPFVQRTKVGAPLEQQLDSLEGATCTLSWYRKVKATWHFFFKFRRRGGEKPCEFTLPNRRDRLWHFAPDLYHNDEEHSSVLQVVTTSFIALPFVMGQRMRKAAISVGHTMRYHKLRLLFTPYRSAPYGGGGSGGGGGGGDGGGGGGGSSSDLVVVIDPVVNVRVLSWWDPAYPGNSPDSVFSSPSTPTENQAAALP